MSWRAIVIALACAFAAPVRAERAVHGSAGAGHVLVITGAGGDHSRFELALDVLPARRWGGVIAWRAFDAEHRGLVLAGVVFEAGAARPRLVVHIHGEAGADLDQRAPAVGGGLRTTLAVWGPFGIGLDTGVHLIIDGIDDTRLAIATSAAAVVRW